MKRQRVLVVGLGTMGLSHARAYEAIDGFDLVGLCTRNATARHDLDQEFAGLPRYERLPEALKALKPDAVDPADVETLEDLIVAAFNDARGKAEAYAAQRMGSVTGGLKIPGM